MTRQTLKEYNTDSAPLYGLKTGAVIGFKLSAVYAIFFSFMCMAGSLSPLFFGIALLYSVIAGVIPAVLVGGISGYIIGVIYTYTSEPLSEWKIVALGWILGISTAIILPLMILFFINGGMFSSSEEIAENLWGFGPLLVCPSIITIFSVGWFVRKIGDNLYPENVIENP